MNLASYRQTLWFGRRLKTLTTSVTKLSPNSSRMTCISTHLFTARVLPNEVRNFIHFNSLAKCIQADQIGPRFFLSLHRPVDYVVQIMTTFTLLTPLFPQKTTSAGWISVRCVIWRTIAETGAMRAMSFVRITTCVCRTRTLQPSPSPQRGSAMVSVFFFRVKFFRK